MDPSQLMGDTGVSTAKVALVVEDDATLRLNMARLLTRMNYLVLQAVDGAEALQIARANPRGIDLVVTDLWMPVMTGDEFAQAFRVTNPRTPIVFISGHAPDGEVEGFLQTGDAAYLAKPFSREALETVIETIRDGTA